MVLTLLNVSPMLHLIGYVFFLLPFGFPAMKPLHMFKILFSFTSQIVFGGDCEPYYASRRRPNLFSHPEVLCRMACAWPCLDPALRQSVFEDLNRLLDDNSGLAEKVLEKVWKLLNKHLIHLIAVACLQFH